MFETLAEAAIFVLEAVLDLLTPGPSRGARRSAEAAPVVGALQAEGVTVSASGRDRRTRLHYVDVPDPEEAGRALDMLVNRSAPVLWEVVGDAHRISWKRRFTKSVASAIRT